MSVHIKVDAVDQGIARMQRSLDALGGKAAAQAIARALNRSLQAARTEASRQARQAYTAPRAKLFDSISVSRATQSALEGVLEVLGVPGVSLIHFQARPNQPQPPKARPRQGVTARVKRTGTRRVYMGREGGSKPFIMRKKQGGYGVFVRHRGNKFEMLFGPSPVQALQRQDTQEKIMDRVAEVFEPRLRHEIDVLLAGIAGGRS